MRHLAHLTLAIAGLAFAGIATQPLPAQADLPQTDPGCGQQLVTSISLRADLACPATGLIVAGDNLTIDLNGHTLTGLDEHSGVGVDVTTHRGTVIRNGTIGGFDVGVSVNGGSLTRIVGNTFQNNGTFAVLLVDSPRNVVTNNTATHTTDAPSVAGIQLVRSNRNVVSLNKLSRNGDGISLYQSNDNRIVGNISSDSGAGIGLNGGSSGNMITGNHTDRNADTGILLDGRADNNTIVLNEASGNGFAGIAVGASDNNTVRYNDTSSNLGSGIAVVDNADGTQVDSNKANNNGATPPGCTPDCPLLNDGIHVDAVNTAIGSNTADGNADLGIDAVVGVTDRGANEAHANGNPTECTGVHCGNGRQ